MSHATEIKHQDHAWPAHGLVTGSTIIMLQANVKQKYLFGRIRSTNTDSAPGIKLLSVNDETTAVFLLRSLSLDKKFSFVAIILGAMPNSPRS